MARSRSKRTAKDRASRRGAGDYLVGYGKPPVATRFKPGQSGNPRGRPKGHRNFRTVVDEMLNERVTIREGDRRRVVTKREALIRSHINNALRGDWKAVISVINIDSRIADEPFPSSHQDPITDDDN